MGIGKSKGAGQTTEGRTSDSTQQYSACGQGRRSQWSYLAAHQGTGRKGLASASTEHLRLGTATMNHTAPWSTRSGSKMTPDLGKMEAFDDLVSPASVLWQEGGADWSRGKREAEEFWFQIISVSLLSKPVQKNKENENRNKFHIQ